MDGDLNGLLSAPSAGVDTQKWSIIMLESNINCIEQKLVELHVHDLDKGQALEAPQPIPSSFDAHTHHHRVPFRVLFKDHSFTI